MSKRPRKRRKQRQSESAKTQTPRNQSFDTLRGLAILLMVIDHCALMFYDVLIEPFTVRFITRLSMPLFCLLTGYLLAGRGRVNWERMLQIALASLVINLFYYTRYLHVEILASLLVCYLAFALLGRYGVIAVVAAWGFPVDASGILFDFPLTVVAACVALGMVWKLADRRMSTIATIVVTFASVMVTPPTVYVLYFVPLASLLVWLAVRYPDINVPALNWVGRYPLSCYTAQYLILMLATSGGG